MLFSNEKPLLLGLTEKVLWQALMRASMSGNTYAALNSFIAKFQDLQLRFQGPEVEVVDWYLKNCM